MTPEIPSQTLITLQQIFDSVVNYPDLQEAEKLIVQNIKHPPTVYVDTFPTTNIATSIGMLKALKENGAMDTQKLIETSTPIINDLFRKYLGGGEADDFTILEIKGYLQNRGLILLSSDRLCSLPKAD